MRQFLTFTVGKDGTAKILAHPRDPLEDHKKASDAAVEKTDDPVYRAATSECKRFSRVHLAVPKWESLEAKRECLKKEAEKRAKAEAEKAKANPPKK